MSVTYKYRVSVPLPAARANAAVQPRSSVTVHGVTGAVAGTAAGVAVGAGASALVPGVDVGVLIAMGFLFGGFNGGLLGLMRHLNGR
jgi:hypothetical protein